MLWQAEVEKQANEFSIVETTSKLQLLLLTMLLLSTRLTKEEMDAPSEHHLYRACKYFFAHFVALGTPCIELIQSGMLISLFECMQCVEDRAPTTLGICIRLAYDLELDDAIAKQSSYKPGEMTPRDEEEVLTWWALQRLER